MGIYRDQFLPRFTDVALGRAMEPTRARVASALRGDVVELGFGSGRNLPHMPASVHRVLAVEPALLCRRLAARRIAQAGFPVEWVGLDGQHLPLDDESADHVLVTWTLCTIPDVEAALAETRRVLRTGGSLHFVEHGRSSSPRVAAWQDRLTPLWGHLFGGCHLNRPIDTLIEQSGLSLDSVQTYSMGGPRVIGFSYEGTATKR